MGLLYLSAVLRTQVALGQSVTASGNLGTQAAAALPQPYVAGARGPGPAVRDAGLGVRNGVARPGRGEYGADRPPGAAVRADLVELHLPIGTCVTGTIAPATRSNDQALRWASVILYLLLLAAWLRVAARTRRRHWPPVPPPPATAPLRAG